MDNLEDNVEIQEGAQLLVTEEMRSYFYDMAKWAGFMAIVGFVVAGISILVAFMMGASIGQGQSMAGVPPQFAAFGPIAVAILFLLMAFLLFYPSLLMFKYSSKAKQGVLYYDQASLIEAISKLKSLFKFWGIMTVIYIGSQILIFIASIATGVAAG